MRTGTVADIGHTDTVVPLLAAKANVDAPYSDGSSPLLMASTSGHLAVVKVCKGDLHAVVGMTLGCKTLSPL